MVGEHHRFIASSTGDGVELLRDFEGMYRSVDDPHGQRISAGNLAHDVYLALVVRITEHAFPSERARSLRYLDMGCGLGYATARVASALRAAGRDVEAAGVDIADAAVERAAAQFGSEIAFSTGSLLDDGLVERVGTGDVVTCFETLYYFKDDEITGVTGTLSALVRPRGLLAVSYHLPERMGYGRYVQSLADLRNLFPDLSPLWEMDFTDSASVIYDGSQFGRHLFSVFQRHA